MVGWIIFGSIVLFIAFLLSCSLVVFVEYEKELKLNVKYLFFTLYRIPALPKKKKLKKAKPKSQSSLEKTNDDSENPPENLSESRSDSDSEENAESEKAENKKDDAAIPKKEKSSKKNISDYIPAIKLAVESAKKPIKRLIKGIRIYDLSVFMLCCGEDAADAALNYGKANALVNGICGWISAFVTLKTNKIVIDVDFQKNESKTEFSFKVKLRVFTALVCGLSFFFNIIIKTFKQKSEEINGGIKNGRPSDSRADEHSNAENQRAC